MWHHTSNSLSGNRVFNPRVLDWNQVYKTWDVGLQNSFKYMLTYDILSPHYASLQITSIICQGFASSRDFFFPLDLNAKNVLLHSYISFPLAVVCIYCTLLFETVVAF